MFFIRLFLANTWEKNRGSPCLFPHKLLWKVDMVLRSQSGWIICAAGTGARYKIKPIVFEVCTRNQACFRLFLCACYRHRRNSYLDRVQQIPWNGVSQDLMRFWSYGFLFWTLIAGVLCSSELGFIFFAFAQQCLTKKLEEKTVDRFLFFICSLVWFLYAAKCEFSSKLRVYIKDWSSTRGSGTTVGLICSTNIRLSTLGVWTTYTQ